MADRVTFEARDAADPSLSGQYDLAVIVEALHDMSRPVEVLASMRRLLAGTLIVADERVADAFHRLGLIPKPVRVAEIVWRPDANK